MMHFIFQARFEDGEWIATATGDFPLPWTTWTIITSAPTSDELEAHIPDAIETHLSSAFGWSGIGYTYDIRKT